MYQAEYASSDSNKNRRYQLKYPKLRYETVYLQISEEYQLEHSGKEEVQPKKRKKSQNQPRKNWYQKTVFVLRKIAKDKVTCISVDEEERQTGSKWEPPADTVKTNTQKRNRFHN